MSSFIELNCFAGSNINYHNRLKTNIDDFLNFNAESLLTIMQERNSDTSYYAYNDILDKTSSLLFLVTKNEDIIKELKLKTVKETRSLSLFDDDELPTNSSFSSLIKTFSVDQTDSDFILDSHGEKYSFKVAYGAKANSLINKLTHYLDDLDLINNMQNTHSSEDSPKTKEIPSFNIISHKFGHIDIEVINNSSQFISKNKNTQKR